MTSGYDSRFSHASSSGDRSIDSAAKLVRVSLNCRGPIRAKVGKGWLSTYASAMLIGSTFRFFARTVEKWISLDLLVDAIESLEIVLGVPAAHEFRVVGLVRRGFAGQEEASRLTGP